VDGWTGEKRKRCGLGKKEKKGNPLKKGHGAVQSKPTSPVARPGIPTMDSHWAKQEKKSLQGKLRKGITHAKHALSEEKRNC